MNKFTIKQIPIGIQLRMTVTLKEGTEVIGVALINQNPHLLVQEPASEAEAAPVLRDRRFMLLAVGRDYELQAGESLRRIDYFEVPSTALVLVLYEIKEKQ